VNAELARDNERAMFVTAFAARLDLATGELEYVNAGHNPTYRLEKSGGVAPLGGAVDPALGAVEGHEYRAGVVRLRPGDALVLYTDGVVEARSASGEEFHALRLEAYLAGCRDTRRTRWCGASSAASRTSPATRPSTTTSPSSRCAGGGGADSRAAGSVLN